jgi:hypothetical protein
VEDLGTFIRFDVVVILSYKYRRRAYIVRNIEELRDHPSITLLDVKQKVGVIY